MSAYLILAYDVSDPEGYAKYSPGSLDIIMSTMARHGGKLLAVGPKPTADWLNVPERDVYVVVEFPSMEAARAWHDDPDYAPARDLRLAATTNIVGFIAPTFVPPG